MTKTQQQHLNSYSIVLLNLAQLYKAAKLGNNDSLQVICNDVIRTTIRKATEQLGCCAGRGKVTALFISESALSQINAGDRSNIIYEHIVPISVLTKLFFLKIDDWNTVDDITKFIIDNAKTALITKAEDDRLKAAKLTKTMPSSETFSRYAHPDVNIKLVERTSEMAAAQKAILNKET